MNTETIIQELEQERDRLQVAIDALNGSGSRRKRTRGRRKLSNAAKARISMGMKKRWKARKAAEKKS